MFSRSSATRLLRASKGALLLGCALALAAPGSANAQTADGVGDSEPRAERPERSAEESAEDILSLSEYERRWYQLTLRMWGLRTPGFALNGFFDLHEDHWTEGTRNFAYGLEFARRTPDKYDLVVSLDWSNLATPDGYWLEDGDPIADADWAENNISLLTADVGVHWFTNLDRQDTWQLYYGVGIGLSIVLGEFRKFDLDTLECGLVLPEQRSSRDTSLIDGCYDANGDPTIDESRSQLESIPPVLPSLSATLGLRHLIADRVSVGLEGGFRGVYFYGGLEVGFFWEATPKVD